MARHKHKKRVRRKGNREEIVLRKRLRKIEDRENGIPKFVVTAISRSY